MNVLAYAARRQGQVFSAVLYREAVNRFARRSLGFIEEIGSIIVHVIAFSGIKIFFGIEQQNGMPILPFICTGVYNLWIFRTGLMQTPAALTAVKSYGAFSQVTPLDVALARAVVNTCLYTALAITTFILLQLFGYSGPVGDWTGVILILVANSIFGFGWGLILAGLFHYVPLMRTVVMIGAIRIFALLDGTFYVLPDLPPNLRVYAMWLPNLQLNDMEREAYFSSYRENWTSITYVTGWIAGTLLFGLLVERALRNAIAAKGQAE